MTHLSRFPPLLLCALLVACGKQEAAPDAASAPEPAAEAAATDTATDTPAPAQAAEPAPAAVSETTEAPDREPTEAERELAEKQALLAYATMEDRYLNDPKGQWASGASASSTYSETYAATRMTGKVDGDEWKNENYTLGFDSAEVTFDTPVSATELRVVIPYGNGVEAITNVELRDPDGNWHSVWSGISEVKKDKRGSRTWFVRSFEKTPYPTQAAKITFANNLQNMLKEIDAVQLVGE